MTCPVCGSHKGLILEHSLYAVFVKCYGCSKILYVREPGHATDVIDTQEANKITWDLAMRPLKEKVYEG